MLTLVGTITWHYYKSVLPLLGQGLLSLTTLLFYHLVCGIMPVIDRKPIGWDNDDEHHSKLIRRQHKNGLNNDASPLFVSIPIGSTVVVQQEDGGLWTHGTIVGETTVTTTNHTSYKLQQLVGESHATDNILDQHH